MHLDMSIASQEIFSISSIYHDPIGRDKEKILSTLVKLFEPGDCKLYRQLLHAKNPLVIIKVRQWSDVLSVSSLDVSIEDGMSIALNNGEQYQLDAKDFQKQSEGIIEPSYCIYLFALKGYSSFLVDL